MRNPDLLPLDFIIVGGSICGLSTAIALTRVGHNVTVFDSTDPFEGTDLGDGCRIPPNSTKVYYRWGMEQRLRQCSVKANGTLFASYDSGAIVSEHEWEEDVLDETGGDFLLLQYGALRKVLAESALEHGATLRFKNQVTAVHPDEKRPGVTLASGEVVRGDVIVGADGHLDSDVYAHICRPTMLAAQESKEQAQPTGMQMLNVTVPEKNVPGEEDRKFLEDLRRNGKVFTWFGPGYGAMLYPMKAVPVGEELFGMCIYVPRYDTALWPDTTNKEYLLNAIKNGDPRLLRFAAHATHTTSVPLIERPTLDEWVHPCGRIVVTGDAAHPIAAGSIYAFGMATGDAAVFGRIFSHVHQHWQVTPFLRAFESLRKERVRRVVQSSMGNIFAVALPPGLAEARDRDLRVRAEKGISTLAHGEVESEQMVEAVETIFGYDPEDEADDWWQTWGVLDEKSHLNASTPGASPVLGPGGFGSEPPAMESMASLLAGMRIEETVEERTSEDEGSFGVQCQSVTTSVYNS